MYVNVGMANHEKRPKQEWDDIRFTHTRDGNVCEAYVIPLLFGLLFTICHPYIDVHFVKCFLCDLFLPFFGG